MLPGVFEVLVGFAGAVEVLEVTLPDVDVAVASARDLL